MSNKRRYMIDCVFLGPKEDGGFGRTTLYRMIERDWASVPRQGDLISLGGGDLVVTEVATVTFLDGHVQLTVLIKQSEYEYVSVLLLKDLGFGPLEVPDAPPAVS